MQELEKWIEEDLAKSGLTGDDIEVILLEPKSRKDGTAIHNGGYQIIYRDGEGIRMNGCNNQPFVRERYRPPLPVDPKGIKKEIWHSHSRRYQAFLSQRCLRVLFRKYRCSPLFDRG